MPRAEVSRQKARETSPTPPPSYSRTHTGRTSIRETDIFGFKPVVGGETTGETRLSHKALTMSRGWSSIFTCSAKVRNIHSVLLLYVFRRRFVHITKVN